MALDAFGVPAANQPLQVSVYSLNLQSVPSNTDTFAIFDSHDYDVGGFHSDTMNNTRLTVPPGGAGVYLFTYYVIWAQAVTVIAQALREAFIKKNGASFGGLSATLIDVTGGQFAFNIASLVALAQDGDYFELDLYSGSSSSQNTGNTSRAFANTFTMTRLR